MNQNDRSRFINIAICIAGLLFCIGSGFITAPLGILGDKALSAAEALGPELLIRFAIPSLLMVIAVIPAVFDRYHTFSLVCAAAGAVLYLYSDVLYVMSYQSYIGILFNALGIIMVIAGICLNNYATDRYDENDSPYISHELLSPVMGNDVYVSDPAEVTTTDADDFSISSQADDIIAALMALDDNHGSEASETVVPESEKAEDEAVHDQAEQDEDIISSLRNAVSAYEERKQQDADRTAEKNKVDEVESLLAQLNDQSNVAETVRPVMTQNLETPNQVMTDFYSGIEDIFLDKESDK